MGKSDRNPPIRILILGDPGVGKNCLESRFTTKTYPPPYDPALTVSSRRYFSLSSRPQTPAAAITRPLDTSHGLPDLSVPILSAPRPPSVSSTFSNPASERVTPLEAGPSIDQPVVGSGLEETPYSPCVECLREADTYLVELINYPALQFSRIRSQVHNKGEYDAVLLVYDVCNRKTFESIVDLHAEIPLRHKRHRIVHTGEEGSSSSAKNRRSVFGLRGGGASKLETTGDGCGRAHGEVVVALVGNKSDFDAEYASVEMGLDGQLLEKEAVLEEADIEERSLVHPLFRESRFYDELDLPLSPGTKSEQGIAATYNDDDDLRAGLRLSVLSADHALDARRSLLLAQRSSRLPQENLETPVRPLPRRSDRVDVIERWVESGGHSSGVEQLLEKEEALTRVASNKTGSTTAAKRQVSRLEGELLVRKLLLQVPFYEASAQTGENVEELFEAIAREVLKEMGRGRSDKDRISGSHERKHHKHGHFEHGRNEAGQLNSDMYSSPDGREDAKNGETLAQHSSVYSGGLAPTVVRHHKRTTMIDKVKRIFGRGHSVESSVPA